MNLCDVISQLKTDWRDIILAYPHLKDIAAFLSKEAEVYGDDVPTLPPKEYIFRCFNYFNAKDTRVVILGQDPYHGSNQAIGLCFGVNEAPPPSLKNIKKVLQGDVNVDLEDISLDKWAQQGILLLNTALTVRWKSPATHMRVWLPFTKYIIDYLNTNGDKIVFVAWGGFAYDKLKDIEQTRHTLLVSSHPSPLSAHRPFRQFPAFMNSHPFSQINNYLKNHAIQW